MTVLQNKMTYSQPCLCNANNANDPDLPLAFDMPTKPSSPSPLTETGTKRGDVSTAGPPLASSGCGRGATSSGMTVARGSLGIVTVRRNFEGSMPLELLRNLCCTVLRNVRLPKKMRLHTLMRRHLDPSHS